MRQKIVIITGLLLLCNCSVKAQSPNKKLSQKIVELTQAHKNHQIQTKAFLRKVDSLTVAFFQQQRYFNSTDTLIKTLSDFRTAAWKSQRYQQYKNHYYKWLMLNSKAIGEGNKAVVYAQKFTESIDTSSVNLYPKPLVLAYRKKVRKLADRGNYKQAYIFLDSLKTMLDNRVTKSTEGMNHLLFNYTKLDYSKNRLLTAEKTNQHCLIWVFVVVGVIFIIILGAIAQYRLQKKRFNVQMASIRAIDKIQAKAAQNQIIQRERQHLSREIKSETVAGLKAVNDRLETIESNIEDDLLGDFKHIKDVAQAINLLVSERSLTLFGQDQKQSAQEFKNDIKEMLPSASPFGRENKLSIQNDAWEALSDKRREALLKITTEGITNIIKHAKYSDEIIIHLFKQKDSIYFKLANKITNNRYQNDKDLFQQGLGLKSMKSRTEALSGTFNVERGDYFVLEVIFPLLFDKV